MTAAERQEHEHLARADRDVARGDRHVARQEQRIMQFREHGQDTTLAEDLLRTFRVSLDHHRVHRALILHRLTQLGMGPI